MKRNLFFIMVIITIILIPIPILISVFCKELSWLYLFFNNQTVAILVGSISIVGGYLIWQVQTRSELVDKYFEILIESAMTTLTIDDDIIYLFEGKQSNASNELFRQKMSMEGKQDAYMMLLEKYGDRRPKKFREIMNDYNNEFVNIIELCRLDELEKALMLYQKMSRHVRNAILHLVKDKEV